MNKNTEPKQLKLEDLDLQADVQNQVKGGWSIDTTFALDWDSDLSWDLGKDDKGSDDALMKGPRPDCGAGDATAWNEGDVTLSEV